MAAVPSTSEPATSALAQLQFELQQALRGRPRQIGWGEPAAMQQALARVRERFGGRQALAREQRIVRGVLALRVLGRQLDFVRLKYVCYGLAQSMDWESRRLLDNREQLQALLETVAGLRRDRRRFVACCRGLVASWHQAAAAGFSHNAVSQEGLERLTRFLRSAAPALPADLHLPAAS